MLNSKMFAGFTFENYDQLSKEISRLQFKKGDSIFKEGDDSTGLFCIKKGVIKLFIQDLNGRESIFDFNGKDELMGDRTIFSADNHFYSAKCITDVEVEFMPRMIFMEAVKDSVQMMKKILSNLSEESIRQIRHGQLLSQANLTQRLAFTFLYLQQKNTATDNWCIDINREDLSNFAGAAKESVVRAMHELKEQGIITSSGRRINLLKPTALRSIAKIDI